MRKVKRLKSGDVVRFVPITDKWGRAEFAVCPVYRYGYLREVWITPMQQENLNIVYLFEVPKEAKTREFSINSWIHKGIDEPNIWRSWWCKEHKTICQELYVPANSNSFKIDLFWSVGLTIRFDKEGIK